jgi:hypothetical protein
MAFHEVVCSYAKHQILVKVEQWEEDLMTPASIKWQVDNILTSDPETKTSFENVTRAESWLTGKCQQLFYNRKVSVIIYSM